MDKAIIALIEKYCSGQCSPYEEEILKDWYHSFDRQAEPPEMSDPLIRKRLENLNLEKINERIERAEKRRQFSRISYLRFKSAAGFFISGIAALLLVAIAFDQFKTSRQDISAATTVARNRHLIRYVNRTANLKRILLEDHSEVWLSPRGSLEIAGNFEKNERRVQLDGMAFFRVTKDPGRPFIIGTSTIITKVWGTSFTVNAYRSSPTARVSVLTGKVSVSLNPQAKSPGAMGQPEEVMLYPQQNVSYTAAGARKLTRHIGTENEDLKIWKTVNLSFRNVRFAEVIKKLNQEFGVQIRVRDEHINDYPLIADFSGQDLASILEILKTSLNIEYEMNGHDITLRSSN